MFFGSFSFVLLVFIIRLTSPGPEVIKLFFVLNSTEHEMYPAQIGILTFISRINVWL